MTLTALIFVLVVLLATLIWKIATRPVPAISTLQEWQKTKSWVNAKSFTLLIDQEGEAYLRRSLPAHLFFVIQRQRTTLAIECAKRIGRNAAMLMQLAQRAECSPDPEIAAAAQQLTNMAVRVKINTIFAVWCLRLKWLFPAAEIRIPSRYLSQHQLMETTLTRLGGSQTPA